MTMEVIEEERHVVTFHGFVKWGMGILASIIVLALSAMTTVLWSMNAQMSEDRGFTRANFTSISIQLDLLRREVTNQDRDESGRSRGQAS